MKIFIRYRFAVSALTAAMMFITANAASSVSVSFNPGTGMVSVDGEAHGHTSIYTLPHSGDSDACLSMYTDFFQVYADGQVHHEFFMPDSAGYQKYTVYVNDGTASKDSFVYYNRTNADEIVDNLGGKSFSETVEYINSNALELGIDSTEKIYIDNSTDAIKILYNHFLPLNNSSEFYNYFTASMVMSEMKDSDKDEIETLLTNYSANLGIESNSYFSLDEDVKKDVCKLLSSMDFDNELTYMKNNNISVGFPSVFDRTIALAAVRRVNSWIDLKKLFNEDYSNVLSEIVSGNSAYSDEIENDVFKRLIQTALFNTYEELHSSFDSAVTYVNDAFSSANNNSGRPSGGSGSGGGSSVSVPQGKDSTDSNFDIIPSADGSEQNVAVFNKPNLSDTKQNYSDLTADNWAYDAVSTLGGCGIVSGYEDGSFRPEKPITRAEFTKLIVSAFDIKADKEEFSDVSKTDWFYPYTSVAAGAEIINGYEGCFNPTSNITREDAAVIIYRLSSKLGKIFHGAKDFADINDVSLYALTAVRSLGGEGIINGDNHMRFNPKNNLTRAQAAQMLYNFILKISQ